jgi:predicted DNA-binding transcriptional regulator AlpA
MNAMLEVARARREESHDSAYAVTAARAATLFGMGVSTWWRSTALGTTPAPIKIGRSTRWRLEELRAWMEAGCPRRERWTEMYPPAARTMPEKSAKREDAI